MKILSLKNITNFVVISDVHLRDPQDTLTSLFISTLKSYSTQECIFLLGDIFDFIAVNTSYFFKFWKNVFDTFQDLKQKGVKIYFIEGNHDFGFEHFKSEFLNNCFEEYGDFTIELHHKSLGLVHLRHGDDVVCSSQYLKFRSLVKNYFFQKCAALLFPGFFMQCLFSRYAKLSRKKDTYRRLEEKFLIQCLQIYYEKFPKLKTFIIGHIHILKDDIIDNRQFLVGPDWLSQPSVLVYNESAGFSRNFILE